MNHSLELVLLLAIVSILMTAAHSGWTIARLRRENTALNATLQAFQLEEDTAFVDWLESVSSPMLAMRVDRDGYGPTATKTVTIIRDGTVIKSPTIRGAWRAHQAVKLVEAGHA